MLSNSDMTKLYGAQVSYYSGKARAYLLWKGIAFEEVIAKRDVYLDEIIPRVGYPIIPIVVTSDNVTVQDTTDIIDYFEQQLPQPAVYPSTPKQNLVSLLLEVYGDEWLLLPAMHYRWNKNEDWTLIEFGKLTLPDANVEQQRSNGERIAGPFRSILPNLGITPNTIAVIEASYEALLGELDAHFARYDYLLGGRPCVGDFGLIGPLYAHLYRDPASGELMQRLAPNVVAWVERMQNPPAPGTGEFLPDDQVPQTLIPILQRMWREQMPVLVDTAKRFSLWQRENPDETIPRSIGEHGFVLEGVREQRNIYPYSLWMIQRPLHFLADLSAGERDAVDEVLDQLNDSQLRGFPTFPVLARRDFKLVCEAAEDNQ